jgi:SAM-dependent methyltransferase
VVVAPLTGDDPYADASLYDLEYGDHTEDVAFYVERARAARGPVVELGCGTGRLTIPLARAGVTVVGVDASDTMLDRLRTKLAAEPQEVRRRITLRCDTWDHFRPAGPVGLVVWPFNALHHSVSAAAFTDTLRTIRTWSAPGTNLVLDAYLPDRTLYDRDPETRYEPRTFHDPATGEELDSWEQGWWDEAALTHHVVYVYRSASGTERRTHLALRMIELPELRASIAAAGWTIASEASDFVGTRLNARSLKWVATLV